MSDNWVVQNLENALDTWNENLSEIWGLLTQSPQDFEGGGKSLSISTVQYRQSVMRCLYFFSL